MKKQFSMKKILLVVTPLCLVSICVAICLGPVTVPFETTVNVILSQIPGVRTLVNGQYEQLDFNIVWMLRTPRVLLGFIVGASLAVCGVAMQALIRNKLADPFVLGVSSGASAAATLGMITGWFSFLGVFELSFTAFLGAAVCIIAVYALSRTNGRVNITTLLLAGVAISMIMDALTSAMALSAKNALAIHNLDFWMTGSLAGAKWAYLTIPFVVMLLCISYLMINYRTLNILLLGDETAVTLGVNVERTQKSLVLIASLLAGATIAVSGAIGFVGMMVPHVCRMLVGSDHKKVLPLSALLGGLLVIWTDVAARMVLAPEELPVGVLTAIIGGPCFIAMLKSKSGRLV